MVTTSVDPPTSADAVRAASVLVVLVVHDGVAWLRETLSALAKQTHPRLGVVAIDNASRDGSHEILVQALGEERVVALTENRGLAGAVSAAVEVPAAVQADYLFVLHDDTALSPDAVSRLVEAAEGIRGVERVGVVGPKVVDWDDPRVLREVGRSTDAFGHPYTPLQDGEIDQGQYDRVLEVLFVSSCAMLISREAWQRTGAFDERFAGHHDDLDFCWRARLAGFRVLMTPLAQARHRSAAARGERDGEHRRRSPRYHAERAALASMLKDYGALTLAWLLPLYVALGLARLVFLGMSRRFEDALDLVTAWGWNLVHLPGTLRRRLRAQSVRSVRDRSVRRFMAATLRVPRWFERAEELFERELEAGSEEVPRARERALSILASHPVLVAGGLAIVLGALAYRPLIGPDALQGGATAAFPGRAVDFFRELLSPVRTTILGGSQPASPALAGLGGLSWLSFGSPPVAQKLLLGALPPLAGVAMYRALSRQTRQPGAAVAAASAYALSGIVLWSFSEGRIPLLVGLVVLPTVWDRLDQAFSREGPVVRVPRFIVGTGAAIAIAVGFAPGLLLAIGVAALAHILGRRILTGVALAAGAAVVGGLLVFPLVPDLVAAPAHALGSFVGTRDVWAIVRLTPGSAPGVRAVASFLPVAAILSLSVTGTELAGRAWRAVAVSVAGLALAFASANLYLPEALTNAPVYLVMAAVGEAALVGFGIASLAAGITRERFGYRQVAAGLLFVALSVGLGAQALQVALGQWTVAEGSLGLPPAWPVVASSSPGEFRILWIGRVDGDRFPAPGGDPQGIVQAGPASVRFALTDREGVSALDTGRAEHGPGYAYLVSCLQELLSGSTGTAGALLGPLGVRFVVGGEGDVPAAALVRLDAQLDLDRVPAGGLTIYQDARALPVASAIDSRGFAKTARTADLAGIAASREPMSTRLSPTRDGWTGSTGGGYVYVAQQFAEGWTASVSGTGIAPQRAFGWGIGFDGAPAGALHVRIPDGALRLAEAVALGVLWLAALWITRKPGSA